MDEHGLEEHPDYRAKRPSPRQSEAELIASILHGKGLCDAATPNRRETPRGSWYEGGFKSEAGVGTYRVYSTEYVWVCYFLAPQPEVPHVRVFASADDAVVFILLAFKEGKLERACTVPLRPEKKTGKTE